MPKKKVKKKEGKNITESEIFAFLSVLLLIIGFLIAIILKKDDKYVMFYAKQGLILFIGAVIIGFLTWIPVVWKILWVFWIIVWIIAWINALSGKKKNTFIIGDIAKKIRI